MTYQNADQNAETIAPNSHSIAEALFCSLEHLATNYMKANAGDACSRCLKLVTATVKEAENTAETLERILGDRPVIQTMNSRLKGRLTQLFTDLSALDARLHNTHLTLSLTFMERFTSPTVMKDFVDETLISYLEDVSTLVSVFKEGTLGFSVLTALEKRVEVLLGLRLTTSDTPEAPADAPAAAVETK